jgi:LEA14-like dessication related protein
MKKPIPLLIVLNISFILTLASCKYENVEFKEVENFKLDKLSLKEVTGTLVVGISNPNKYKIKITEYDVNMTFNNIDFHAVNPNADIIIPSKSDTLVTVPVNLTVESNLLSFKTIQILTKTLSEKSAELTMKGYLNVRVGLLTKKIPVDEKTVVNFNKNH